MTTINILDSTLRDGAQCEGISFTMQDKIDIVKKLDRLGISYIEAGNPFSNIKDLEFFETAKSMNLKNSKLVAFGSTRRKNINVNEDSGIKALIKADTEVVTIFGKSSLSQVKEVLETTPDENILMIKDTIAYLKNAQKTVFFDAEHFFDGYLENKDYAIKTIITAQNAGADCIILCDTKGATFPTEIANITKKIKSLLNCCVGIHCHNDIGCAVANSIIAVDSGATQVQGTYLGLGERCGNANLSTVIPDLQCKKNYSCIPDECVPLLTQTARYIAEIANVVLPNYYPYVGKSAFAHKGGMHVDGVAKKTSTFEHINPENVGNKRSFLISEMAGRSAVLNIVNEFDVKIDKNSGEAAEIVNLLKEQELNGYVFEAATASLELLVKKHLKLIKPFFELVYFKVIGEQVKGYEEKLSSAMIKIKVGQKTEITAAEGSGPVNALDIALKKAVV
ncbi:MAG: citramalate synthase, partial [Oscillospiraceae bacterium]